MGQYVFRLPDVAEGTAEAEIAAWHVAVGDRVKEDQPLVDVTTDKATVEISSPVSGTVLSISGSPGDKLAIGSTLAVLEVIGAGNGAADAVPDRSAAAAAPAAPRPTRAPDPPKPAPDGPAREPSRPPRAARTSGDRPAASPAVRQRARELGVELQFVPGSGPAGRITHEDLDTLMASGGRRSAVTPRLPQRDGVEEVKIIGVRRAIAERMQESKRRIPHFSYVEEVDVTALEELRQHLNATRTGTAAKLTLLPFLMRALARALPEHPEINARFDDEAGIVRRHAAVHVGIATQTPHGLLVPVVRHAETLGLDDCAAEVARLAEAARTGKASRAELTGSTITISSLGPLGGLAATPVINHPEVAIVAVNKIVERPVIRDGQVVARKMMNLSSSFDHRVVDGWNAAAFIQRVKGYLEQPATLFMD